MANGELSFLDGKTVLVTGGTGSFGQKFTEHILRASFFGCFRHIKLADQGG